METESSTSLQSAAVTVAMEFTGLGSFTVSKVSRGKRFLWDKHKICCYKKTLPISNVKRVGRYEASGLGVCCHLCMLAEEI